MPDPTPAAPHGYCHKCGKMIERRAYGDGYDPKTGLPTAMTWRGCWTCGGQSRVESTPEERHKIHDAHRAKVARAAAGPTALQRFNRWVGSAAVIFALAGVLSWTGVPQDIWRWATTPQPRAVLPTVPAIRPVLAVGRVVAVDIETHGLTLTLDLVDGQRVQYAGLHTRASAGGRRPIPGDRVRIVGDGSGRLVEWDEPADGGGEEF